MNNLKKVIVWRITQNCNMNCLFCSYSNEIKRRRDVANDADISKFLKLLGTYKKETNQEMLISWIGGEPFLWDHLMDFSKAINMQFGIDVSTTTNGLMLSSEKLRAEVIEYFSEIVFSIDGFSVCNDRIRQYNGHFERVVKNIIDMDNERKARDSNLIIKVNTILVRENIEHFESFCYKLAEIGVKELTFNQLGGYDRPEFYQENRLLDYQVRKFLLELPGIKEKFSKMGLQIHGSNDYLRRIMFSTEDKRIPVDDCYPGRWFWFINENGYISPCSYTSYEYKLQINSIESITDIYKSEEYFRNVRETKRSSWCDDCHCTQLYNKFE